MRVGYEFDVRRLWEPESLPETAAPSPPPARPTARPAELPPAPAQIVAFPGQPAPGAPAPGQLAPGAPAAQTAKKAPACRRQTKAELQAIATSLSTRDALRRAWIADRCAACGKCPDMTG